ncbi:hypothetical protein GE21DRAFT_8051 [Neurospora crassa]|uniref:Uncharacterized protein n=2 Tax=Neurospora crassa TaxID=5141 RepID=Q1K4R1_NEUCR|nr:hypothetical protein NCU01448 [Neurospora crassa OR74A]EAA26734.1 hypothetical protein NCU01448 [Neurospora crassa OR74A]KHE80004.1 hypothetical protein GE21DRAFT_8051 [Neurospora crassa]CAD70960.1 hypothetical protein [Neurospora crassa]|eukprot:XP_955970.1 hypothetical protein NCU01448 [Neurospora crassa OR74A]
MLPTTDAGGGVPQSDRVPWLRISETSAPCPPVPFPPVPSGSETTWGCMDLKNSQHRNGWCRYRGELSSPSDTTACKLREKSSKVPVFTNSITLPCCSQGNLSRAKAISNDDKRGGRLIEQDALITVSRQVRTLDGGCLDVKCQICPITSPRSICSRSSQSWGRYFVGQGGDQIGGPHAKAPALSCKWKCET